MYFLHKEAAIPTTSPIIPVVRITRTVYTLTVDCVNGELTVEAKTVLTGEVVDDN